MTGRSGWDMAAKAPGGSRVGATDKGTGVDTSNAAFAFPVLVGDIGGTNVRFGVIEAPDAPLVALSPAATAASPDIQSAIRDVVVEGGGFRPRSAIIAGAGPVLPEGLDLTNAHWVIRPPEAMAAIGLGDMVLLNDFEAQALAVANLDDPEMTSAAIGPDVAVTDNCRVIVGAGTGLGVAGLVFVAGRWTPVPGEGGHVALGAVEPDEFAIWPNIEPEGGRLSAESLLCGRGIVRLYRGVAATRGVAPVHATPAEVSGAALDALASGGGDPVALETMRLYCRLLGRVAGDLAVIFMATGGVFIAGGIPPRIVPLLAEGGFRDAFEAKWPHEALMARMPTRLLTARDPGLLGLAAYGRAPHRFQVPLAGRRWRSS